MNKSKIDKLIISLISLIIPLFLASQLVSKINAQGFQYSYVQGVELLKTLLGVWNTLLGFMITSVSILLAVGNNEYITAFRNSNHYHTVMYTQLLACLVLFCATVFCIVLICMELWNPCCLYWFIYFLVSSFFVLALSLVFMFFVIVKSIDQS